MLPRAAAAQCGQPPCAHPATGPGLTLTADATQAPAHTLVSLFAVADPSATGIVDFTDNGSPLAQATLGGNGVAVFSSAALAAGTHSITARYAGDQTHPAASAEPVTLTIAGLAAPFTLQAAPSTVSIGSPVQLTAYSLPADASGTVQFFDASGNNLASATILRTATPSVLSFGDSITFGTGASSFSRAYASVFAQAEGLALTDYGTGGAYTCDLLPFQILQHAVGPTQAAAPLTTLLSGTNDAIFNGAGPHEAVFNTCHQAAIAWLAIPREFKLLPGDAAITTTGAWTANTTWDRTAYNTLFNTSGSGTATFPLVTSGAPLYLWYLLRDGTAGTFQVAVDGVDTGSTYSTQSNPWVSSQSGVGFSLLRLPVPPGSHILTVTVTSGSVGILALGTPPSPSAAAGVHPTVLVGEVPNQRLSAPFTPAATSGAYAQDSHDNVDLLRADGLDIRFAPTRQYLRGIDGEMADGTHPNDLGHAHLAQAFQGVLQGSTAVFGVYTSAPPAATISFPTPGTQGLTAVYSGDTVYAGASSAPASVTVVDTRTGTTLAATATVAPYGTPVTLTASIMPATATGTVTFVDSGGVPLGSATVNAGRATLTFTPAGGTHSIAAVYSSGNGLQGSSSAPLALTVTPLVTVMGFAPSTTTPAFGDPVDFTLSVLATSTPAIPLPAASLSQAFLDSTVFMGDSITAWWPLPVHNAGMPGETAAQIGLRFVRDTIGHGYERTILLAGTNDILHTANDPATTLASIAVMADQAAAAGMPIALATIPPITSNGVDMNARVDALNAAIATLAVQRHLPLVDYHSAFAGHSGYQGDGVHPNAAGYTVMQSMLAGTLFLPAGTVQLSDGTSTTLSATGTAHLRRGMLTPSHYTLTAAYPGSNDFQPFSASVALPVAPAATTVTLALAPIAGSNTLALAAQLNYSTPATATGSLNFYDGSALLARVPLASNSASFTTPSLPIGLHSFTASFAGQPELAAASSTPLAYNVLGLDANVVLDPYIPAEPSVRYAPAGVSATFSTQVQPADATGNVAFSVDGAPYATVPLAPISHADLTAFGDSRTYGSWLAEPATRWPSVLAAAPGLRATNLAADSYTACDLLPLEVLPTGSGLTGSPSPLFALLTGNEDAASASASTRLATFHLCHQALLTWLAVPRTSKLLPGDAAFTTLAGSWHASSPGCCNTVIQTTSGGSASLTLNVAGNAAYLWYGLQFAAGSFTVAVDGGPPSAPISTQATVPIGVSPVSYAVLRLPLPLGTHTLTLTAAGTVALLGAGSPALSGRPAVLVGTPLAPAGSASLAAFDAAVRADVALLAADSLDLRLADTSRTFSGSPAELLDPAHPSPAGMAHIATAFANALASGPAAPASIAFTGAELSLSALPPGSHKIVAAYSGDTRYRPAVTETNYTLYDGTTVTTLGTHAATLAAGATLTLTASISSALDLSTVTFEESTAAGTVPLGAALVRGRTATLSLPSLSPGQHTFLARYLGDLRNHPSASGGYIVTVLPPTPTRTRLSAPATTYTYGAPISLGATVLPASTGSVGFYDGANLLGTTTLANGSATFSTSTLAVGLHTLTAVSTGDAAYAGSTSPGLQIAIALIPASIVLAPLPPSAPYGTGITLTARLTPGAGTGTILFMDSFAAPGQAAVPQALPAPACANGIASLTLDALAVGTHTFTAAYAGDATTSTATSAPAITRLAALDSTVTLASLPPAIPYGSAVPLSATVTPADATGSVAFRDSVSGTLAIAMLVSGSASFSAANLAPGLHTLSASYAGDATHSASTSALATLTVQPAASQLTLATPPASILIGNPLTLTLAFAPASATGTVTLHASGGAAVAQAPLNAGTATFRLGSQAVGSHAWYADFAGDPYTAAATSNTVGTQVLLNPTTTLLAPVPASSYYTTPLQLSAAITPATATGTVTFYDGTSTIGSAPVFNGTAGITQSTLPVGTHQLSAVYNGDSLYAQSTSTGQPAATLPDTTSTTLSLAQVSVPAGQPVQFNVQVTAYPDSVPTGTVSIRSGSTVLATAPLANAAAGAGYATLSVPSAPLGLGTFPVVAYYSGDVDNSLSNSAAQPLSFAVVATPTATALQLSATQAAPQMPITLTATVVTALPALNGLIPTGSVTFHNGSATLGTVPLGPLGTASLTLPSQAIGNYSLSAVYLPVGLFAASSAPSQLFTVTPPVALALSATGLDMTPATTQTSTLTARSLSGFAGAVSLTCSSPVTWLACNVGQMPALAAGGSGTATVQLTLRRDTLFAVSLHPADTQGTATVLLTAALLLPILLRRRGSNLLTLLLGTAALAALSGCAQGGTFGQIPAGQQTVTIAATGAGATVTIPLDVHVSP